MQKNRGKPEPKQDLSSLSDLELFQELGKRLAEKHQTDPSTLLIPTPTPQNTIPLPIFTGSLSPLEAVVKYLHENHKLSFTAIGIKLNRSVKTIWQAYQTAKKKMPEPFTPFKGETLPLSELSNRTFSLYENLVLYLSKKHRPKEIALLINRPQRNINTILSRARKKDQQTKTES